MGDRFGDRFTARLSVRFIWFGLGTLKRPPKRSGHAITAAVALLSHCC
jgi:hypothetical protein